MDNKTVKKILLGYLAGDNSAEFKLTNAQILAWCKKWNAQYKRFFTMGDYPRAYDYKCAVLKCSMLLY